MLYTFIKPNLLRFEKKVYGCGAKKRSVGKLLATDGNELLSIVIEDIQLYEVAKTKDVTDGLSEEELEEPKNDKNISVSDDSVTYEALKESISR